ncbi:hypothetical protein DMUE_4328 [Dictyocoela muelleri]|nr:hypothetical protein DMUE_4328 [Dictyocoela muelleri]
MIVFPLTTIEIKRILGMENTKNPAKSSFLNNKQIISEVFKKLDISEIASFSKQKSINRTILNVRQNILNNYEQTDDIPNGFKFSINREKFLQYDMVSQMIRDY